ncbi:MAG TPA: PhzF family phenazine biosynthesis protein [Telluria sp.]|nr:PhzF family phenazine biosynthesis protein [Telluria sp.]
MTQSSNLAQAANTREFLCFGAEDDQGNPALVVMQGSPSGDQRQQFARDSGKTCVFVDAVDDAPAGFVLDFYYPHARSPLCVHATIAAAALLANDTPVTVSTAMRGQRMELRKNGDTCSVSLQRHDASDVQVSTALLRELLSAPSVELVGDARVASVGSPKLLVQVKDVATLHALRPDLHAIAAWSKASGVNGIYAYCVRDDGDIEGRNFNHLDPALEDSATGVAAGALTVLFGRAVRVHQGATQRNPCLIVTGIEGDTVHVGGRVAARAMAPQ